MSTIIREVPSDALETSRIGDFLGWVNAKVRLLVHRLG